jgi:hypothetical protein
MNYLRITLLAAVGGLSMLAAGCSHDHDDDHRHHGRYDRDWDRRVEPAGYRYDPRYDRDRDHDGVPDDREGRYRHDRY